MAILIALSVPGPSPTLPEEAAGWRASGAVAVYDRESIFRYIDGHGEVYLAYGMRSCSARRYSGPPGESDLIVDVFEMASSSDAFGVFTHSRDGEPAAIGQDSTFAFNTLLFWKGRYFVSVYAEQESARAKEAVLALGRAVAAAIPEAGEAPALVTRLPRQGLDERSLVWLRHPRILDAHAHPGPDGTLGVSASAPAAIGRYLRGGERAELVLVSYADVAAEEKAASAFAARWLGPGGRPAQRDDGWYASMKVPGTTPLHAFVLRASSRGMAEELLAELSKGAAP